MERVIGVLRLGELTAIDLVDILLVSILLYYVFEAVRGTRAAQMLLGIVLFLSAYQLTGRIGLVTLHKVLAYAIQYVPFIVIVVFQAEIRRALTALGKYPLVRWFYPVRTTEDVLGEVVFAASALSSQRIGALVVLERSQRLKQYVEAGIQIDAHVSYDLLVNIFHPDTPLHDGAVIVREGRIAAAACFLPLTLQPEMSKALGTRHRAAVGITEETDAVAVIVSEESGTISIAVEGKVIRNLDSEALRDQLRPLFGVAAVEGNDETKHAASA